MSKRLFTYDIHEARLEADFKKWGIGKPTRQRQHTVKKRKRWMFF